MINRRLVYFKDDLGSFYKIDEVKILDLLLL